MREERENITQQESMGVYDFLFFIPSVSWCYDVSHSSFLPLQTVYGLVAIKQKG